MINNKHTVFNSLRSFESGKNTVPFLIIFNIIITPDAEESNKIEKGDDLWNLVQSTMDTIKTDEQKIKFATMLREFAAQNISQNNPLDTGATGLTTRMLGSNESNQVIQDHQKVRNKFMKVNNICNL
jgi:hypothetical protein